MPHLAVGAPAPKWVPIMPELPDVEVYVECLRRRIVGRPCLGVRIGNPFVLRSVEPPLESLTDSVVNGVRRLGKRLVIATENELFIVIHLMIAGRLRWRDDAVDIPRRIGLAAIDFPHGTVLMTEAGSTKRASIHVVQGEASLQLHDRGGLEVFKIDLSAFAKTLRQENHTLKRALTDPRLFSGIGNAYSDEILHAARLSPLALTQRLNDEQVERLFIATIQTLSDWVERLRTEVGDGFPEKVTAFRTGMAVHGRYRQPCPTCGSAIQRIVYLSNEVNYCPRCQTNGRLLADRAMSRLLKSDWPKTLEAWEERF